MVDLVITIIYVTLYSVQVKSQQALPSHHSVLSLQAAASQQKHSSEYKKQSCVACNTDRKNTMTPVYLIQGHQTPCKTLQ